MDRGTAEKHWEYTRTIIVLMFKMFLIIARFLYVEAMLHGAKHQGENVEKEVEN